MKKTTALLFGLVGGCLALQAAEADRFVFAQLERPGRWDPYPDFWEGNVLTLRNLTRLDPDPRRRVVRLEDPAIFESPFLVVGGQGPVNLSENDLEIARRYLSAGGFFFFDDAQASLESAFSRSVRRLPDTLFPGSRWRPIPADHALHRAFFLTQGAAGRKRADGDLQGLWLADRLVAVWCANDLMGALARDRKGDPLLPCVPGGEAQREKSLRQWVNIVVFSVTGTYKTDAVHQPFIERKVQRMQTK
ncbi:MAG: DUF4159 domain-containing protein [Elusimicrobia bacterium]|nr:DUF4159 domain-containing protein [Elusimicrobiota bacterium]MBP9127216.1 DUF4159 domain-containing protein [Elusimicrobiota bacterium]MBP9699009.1 DUF4159 domain-containing protein [Elusimicrobiota bacterium]